MGKKVFAKSITLAFTLFFLLPVSGWTTVYVDGSNIKGPWDGNSWATAYGSVQDGLTDAEKNKEEVWVAKGVYKPTLSDDRNVSFQLKSGVGLYGGFSGNEDLRDKRDPEINPTVLSGEIGDPGNREDNSYNVVISADNTIIDGFTIMNGYAMPEGGNEFRIAGGSRQSHGYVSALTDGSTGGEPSGTMEGRGQSQGAPGSGLEGNMQGRGAAQGERSGGPAGNMQGRGGQQGGQPGGQQGGGGNNVSGGGMLVSHSNVTINNCVFKENFGGRGGGIYMMGSRRGPGGETGVSESQPQLTNCDFKRATLVDDIFLRVDLTECDFSSVTVTCLTVTMCEVPEEFQELFEVNHLLYSPAVFEWEPTPTDVDVDVIDFNEEEDEEDDEDRPW